MTTVPNPCIEKTLSIGSLNSSGSSRLFDSRSHFFNISAFRTSMFSPVLDETAIMGFPSRKEPLKYSFTSSTSISSHSSSTISFLVIAMMPSSIPSACNISKCSLVCGMIPSSAATTNNTKSTPPIPASIFLINFSCPGTSITPIL